MIREGLRLACLGLSPGEMTAAALGGFVGGVLTACWLLTHAPRPH